MKKLLYAVYIPLLVAEWFLDMFTKIWQIIHNSVKDITLALEIYINEPNSQESPSSNRAD